ncbi:MAG: OB-fold domain-containing protein [Polaromonas sp.]|uniref:Zn-ribbon domain-containing OB-fold protein n=1 Tax=Polaromonas sp. TaxID=1869339 RepID=UPI0025D254FC|nr:OB-fold domain-containing protein [Polaromonas sp.]MBI2727173.1 OB-fold domain-containing protein [Polaromonas sp.]
MDIHEQHLDERSDTRLTEEFRRSIVDGQMALPFCMKCLRFSFYPRPFCPHCWSSSIEMKPVSGEGVVWSYTIVHFAHGGTSGWHARLPYVVALIELAENVRMMANIVDCDLELLQVGVAVEVDYRQFDGVSLPVFVSRT